jgi:hypothetical protein
MHISLHFDLFVGDDSKTELPLEPGKRDSYPRFSCLESHALEASHITNTSNTLIKKPLGALDARPPALSTGTVRCRALNILPGN